MKKLFFLVIIVAIGFSQKSFSQENSEDKNHHMPLEKIEQLEKAKLIELLDLKEEAAVRLFT